MDPLSGAVDSTLLCRRTHRTLRMVKKADEGRYGKRQRLIRKRLRAARKDGGTWITIAGEAVL